MQVKASQALRRFAKTPGEDVPKTRHVRISDDPSGAEGPAGNCEYTTSQTEITGSGSRVSIWRKHSTVAITRTDCYKEVRSRYLKEIRSKSFTQLSSKAIPSL